MSVTHHRISNGSPPAARNGEIELRTDGETELERAFYARGAEGADLGDLDDGFDEPAPAGRARRRLLIATVCGLALGAGGFLSLRSPADPSARSELPPAVAVAELPPAPPPIAAVPAASPPIAPAPAAPPPIAAAPAASAPIATAPPAAAGQTEVAPAAPPEARPVSAPRKSAGHTHRDARRSPTHARPSAGRLRHDGTVDPFGH